MVFDSHIPRDQLVALLGPLANSLSDSMRNLGVYLESSFKLNKQVSSVVKSGFFQLRQISKAKHYIPFYFIKFIIFTAVFVLLAYFVFI